MADAIQVEDLRKAFGSTTAVDGLSFTVGEGTVLGLLGPNGAGKTTIIRILATLLRPDSGRVRVCGIDAVAAARRVRPLIGLTGQYAAVDEKLTGTENLRLFGRLARLGRATSRRNAAELLERMDLTDAADRQVKTYSGGMRRRLDLAVSLISRPHVLFLDEPTTGLDVRSRLALWASVRELAAGGTTVLLTTQYLDEADNLADVITVMDHGRLVTTGTPAELKDRVGGDRVELGLTAADRLGDAARIVEGVTGEGVTVDERALRLTLPLAAGDAAELPAILRELHDADTTVADIAIRRPTLDDAFLALTGAGRPGADASAAEEGHR